MQAQPMLLKCMNLDKLAHLLTNQSKMLSHRQKMFGLAIDYLRLGHCVVGRGVLQLSNH
jgi:hypothetical protein